MGWIIFKVVFLSPFTYAFTRFFFRPKFPLLAHATSFGHDFLIFVYEFFSIFYGFGFLCLLTIFAIFRHTQKGMTKISRISFRSLTFGPWEIWSPRNWGPRNLVSEKFSPPRNLVPAWKSFYSILCRDQISRVPNF